MLEDKSFQHDREWRGEDGTPLQGTQAIPLDCHGVSQIGKGRRVNQDDYLLTPLDIPSDSAQGPAFLFAVADGIGGGPAGDRASSSAIQTLHQFVRRTVSEPGLLQAIDPGELLRKGVLRCHDEILADVDAHPELFGMGTTLTAALVLWPKVWIVNAGDSRCYLLRDSRLERLTFDHTLVQKLTDEGILTPETARKSRWRHALWNHLGKNSSPLDPQLATADLQLGDGLLLTTDGVTDPLLDEEIEVLLREPASARRLSRLILQAADVKGARDDMSLVFARFARRVGNEPEPD
ncbi:MAG TPA: protein phosphatase 2C domain-containing protein [Planctomycetota bacterium]|jgi:protein phosphatase|nr:protein phosphatase 2C domain-containing protein [Planctomycetota bacterium]